MLSGQGGGTGLGPCHSAWSPTAACTAWTERTAECGRPRAASRPRRLQEAQGESTEEGPGASPSAPSPDRPWAPGRDGHAADFLSRKSLRTEGGCPAAGRRGPQSSLPTLSRGVSVTLKDSSLRSGPAWLASVSHPRSGSGRAPGADAGARGSVSLGTWRGPRSRDAIPGPTRAVTTRAFLGRWGLLRGSCAVAAAHLLPAPDTCSWGGCGRQRDGGVPLTRPVHAWPPARSLPPGHPAHTPVQTSERAPHGRKPCFRLTFMKIQKHLRFS